MDYQRHKHTIIACAISTVTIPANAALIAPSDLTVYSLGNVYTDRNFQSTGSIGGASVSISRDTVIGGGVYSSFQDISIARNSRISGDIASARNLSIDRDAVITGAQHASGNIWNARNGSFTSVYAGGNFSTDRDSLYTGSVNAGSRVSVAGGSTIQGAVNANGSIWIDPSATAGAIQAAPAIAPATWAGAPSITRDTLDPAPTAGEWHNAGSAVDLDPGTYGSISAGSGTTFNFTSGYYHFSSLSLSSDTRFVADVTSGDINIVLDNRFSAGSSFTVEIIGGDATNLTLTTGDSASFGANTTFNGQLYVHDGSVWFDANSAVTGFVYGEDSVGFGRDSSITLAAVPAPSSGVLAIISAGISLRRRSRISIPNG